MSRWAQGVLPAKWCRNSAAVIDDRLAALRAVRELRVAALDHARRSRGGAAVARASSPDAAAAASSCEANVVVVGEQPGVERAERDDDGAGQGGDVDQPLGALGERVGDAVAEHEPALGVGVVDLDRRPVAGGDDVAGLDGGAARQVLGRADQRRSPGPGAAELGERRDRLDHGGAAGHVELHLVHRRRRLERQSAGVERDRLADQRHRRRAGDRTARRSRAGSARRLRPSPGRPPANAPIPAARIDALARARSRATPSIARRVLGERGGRQVVGGRVREIAGAVLAPRHGGRVGPSSETSWWALMSRCSTRRAEAAVFGL